MGHFHHVGVRGIGATADGHLIHFDLAKRIDGFVLIGEMGLCHRGHDPSQIQFHDFVVNRIFRGANRFKIVASSVATHKSFGDLIGRENRCSGAQFRAHIANRGTIGDGKIFHAFP